MEVYCVDIFIVFPESLWLSEKGSPEPPNEAKITRLHSRTGKYMGSFKFSVLRFGVGGVDFGAYDPL